MLTRTRLLARRGSRHHTQGPAAAPQTPVANGNNAAQATQNDALALTTASQERNPYEGVAAGFSKVKVDAWGQGQNGSVEQILLNQGYSSREIYTKSADGKTLLDEVARVNGLRNPNLIQQGQDLTVPSKQAPEQNTAPPAEEAPPRTETAPPAAPEREAQAATPTEPQPPANQETQPAEPSVNKIKVDRWGQGPNSSLDAILKSQGFKEEDIYRQDANGDSLLKKIARANGLKSPDKIQAGQSLEIPNSKEALAQMTIPDMPPPPVVQRTEPERAPVNTQSPDNSTAPPAETAPPVQEQRSTSNADQDREITANMGMLLDGAKQGKFTRQEFQYLNARSSRYAQMRARYSNDGYTNEELTQLGQMEKRYGVEFARLSESDTVPLPEFPRTTSDPDLAIQIKHYHESGPLFDSYKNGTSNSEDALQVMVRQRTEARQQEIN
jgi:LysM repeat protein